MAEALLAGFINVLLERLAPQDAILKYFQGKEDVAKQIEKLTLRLKFAPVKLKYAEEKQLTEKVVEVWLDELNEVITRAAFLLDDIDYQAWQSKMEDESASIFGKWVNYLSTKFARSFERNVIDEVNVIVHKLDYLSEKQGQLGLTHGFPNRSSKISPKNSDVYGRDKDQEEIVKFLLLDDTNAGKLSLISIVGMCGVGKSTLAWLVYNNDSVQEHFELKAWVDVYEEIRSDEIMKSILEKIPGEQPSTEEGHEHGRPLVEALDGKKFLFVFDNFWEKSLPVWDEIKDAFKYGAPGSKIIVTTCSKIVGSNMGGSKRGNVAMHELHLISDEDCWKIFEKLVFDDQFDPVKYPDLKDIGMEIVKKCEGLPLAVNSLAKVMCPVSDLQDMRKTLYEWGKKLEIDIWKLLFEEKQRFNILPDLWPSYQLLPPVLKRCLAYCSIFPKDYEFCKSDREKIILLWMAQGLLKPENGKRMEDVEEENLEALISKSFFQYSSRSGKQYFVMHGLVQDLAMRISPEFCFYCGDSISLGKLGTETRHLSYEKGSDVLMKLAKLPKPECSLHTLLALPLSSNSGGNNQVLEKNLLDDLFQKGKYFKILSLSGSSVAEIPKSIANVKYLRYIDFSDTQLKRLPDSICDLFKLQTLILSGCKELEELPARLAALVNLFHLDIRDTLSLKGMPRQMGKMKNLHRLSDFVLDERGCSSIKELAELEFLGGSLCIRGLENIVDVSDVDAANLKDKKFLTELILIWKSEPGVDASQQEKVLNALKPHTKLKQLTIDGYRGTNFPDWEGHGTTFLMDEIRLIGCKNCVTLQPFEKLRYLRRLDIRYCETLWKNRMTWDLQKLLCLKSLCLWGIKEEVDSFPEEGLLPTTLTNLCIRDFERLKSLNGRAFQHLTSLQQLEISRCDRLEGLTEEVLPKSLSHLCICDCRLLRQRCQRETGDDWPKIGHIQRIEIDGQEI